MAIQKGTYDIEIYRGDSRVFEFSFVNIDNQTGIESVADLSTVNVKAQVRYSEDSPDIWMDLEPEIVNAATGLIRITINASKSAGAVLPSSSGAPSAGVWDMQFTDKTNPEIVDTVLVGKFIVRKDITRP